MWEQFGVQNIRSEISEIGVNNAVGKQATRILGWSMNIPRPVLHIL